MFLKKMQVKESYKKRLQHLTIFIKKTLSKETKQKKPTQKNEKMKRNERKFTRSIWSLVLQALTFDLHRARRRGKYQTNQGNKKRTNTKQQQQSFSQKVPEVQNNSTQTLA